MVIHFLLNDNIQRIKEQKIKMPKPADVIRNEAADKKQGTGLFTTQTLLL